MEVNNKLNILIPIFFLSLGFFVLPSITLAANHYIRDGATGTGDCGAATNSWLNACDDLPAAFIRGDIYYVADGVYGGHEFKTAASGNQYITIKKATQADHGTEAGWQNEWGNGQAVFEGKNFTYNNVWTISSSYWIFDGQVGSGNGQAIPYGFKVDFEVQPPVVPNNTRGYGISTGNANVSFITVKYIEIDGNNEGLGDCGEACFAYRSYGWYTNNSSANNITLSHNYIHDMTTTHIIIAAHDVVVEYNRTERRFGACYYSNGSYPTIHGESIIFRPESYNITVRYNTIVDSRGTGLIMAEDSVNYHDFYIYGNLSYATNPKYITTNGAIANSGGDAMRNSYVYNNTFVNLTGYSQGINWYGTNDNNIAYNNLWYNCERVNFTNVTHDYNAFSGTNAFSESHAQTGLTQDIFKNYANNDFSLNQATQAGKADLGSPYDKDILNITRGQDSVWDRGAYEYVSGSPPPPTCTILGDLSCNQEVDAPDIQIAINVFLGIETNQDRITRSDVNTDLKTDILDIQKIINLFLNL